MRALAGIALSIVLPVTAGCTYLFFHPMARQVYDPDAAGIPHETVEFEAADGTALHGWLLSSRVPETHATILFLYGNAENKSTHIANVHWLPDHGFNVFLFDYRGYGKSAGRPDLRGMHLDIDAALRHLLDHEAPRRHRVIVFGQSLGGALALTAVADSEWRAGIEGVVVEGAFSGYRAIAREKLSAHWLTRPLAWPLSYTVSGRYRPRDAAAGIAPIPLLLVYATDDRVVPPHHGDILYEHAQEPKWMWKVSGVPHVSVFRDEARRQALVEMMRGWLE